jgi:hypothetical protein
MKMNTHKKNVGKKKSIKKEDKNTHIHISTQNI